MTTAKELKELTLASNQLVDQEMAQAVKRAQAAAEHGHFSYRYNTGKELPWDCYRKIETKAHDLGFRIFPSHEGDRSQGDPITGFCLDWEHAT